MFLDGHVIPALLVRTSGTTLAAQSRAAAMSIPGPVPAACKFLRNVLDLATPYTFEADNFEYVVNLAMTGLAPQPRFPSGTPERTPRSGLRTRCR